MYTLLLLALFVVVTAILGLALINGTTLPVYERVRVTDLRLGVEVQEGFGARLADRMLSKHTAELMDGRALAHRELRAMCDCEPGDYGCFQCLVGPHEVNDPGVGV